MEEKELEELPENIIEESDKLLNGEKEEKDNLANLKVGEDVPLKEDKNDKQITKEEKDEKNSLKNILKSLYKNLDRNEKESINDVYGEYLNNEDITKRYVDNTGECCLCIMFYILSPLFSMINLIAIFQSIYIMSTLSEIILNTIPYFIKSLRNAPQPQFSIEDFNENYNFYDILMTRTLNEPFDFNLMLFMAFLGDALLKAKGLTFTLGIFCLLINGIAFILLYVFDFKDYDKEYNSFAFFDILYLIFCYVLLFIGVGSSALLSQQIIVESNVKYNEYLVIRKEEREKKLKEKEENKKDIKEKRKKEEEEMKTKNDNGDKKVIIELKDDLIDKEEKKESNEDEAVKIELKEDEEKDLIKEESNPEKAGEKINETETSKSVKFEFFSDEEIINSANIEKEKPNVKLERLKTRKKKKKKKKKEKKSEPRKIKTKGKKRFDSFFEICITTIIAYFSKYFININLTNKMLANKDSNKKYYFDNNQTNYENFMKSQNISESNQSLYDSILYDIYDYDQNLYVMMIGSYFISLFISWIFYKIFVCNLVKMDTTKKNKENNKNKVEEIDGIIKQNDENKSIENHAEDSHRICEICGYIIYSENIQLNKDDTKEPLKDTKLIINIKDNPDNPNNDNPNIENNQDNLNNLINQDNPNNENIPNIQDNPPKNQDNTNNENIPHNKNKQKENKCNWLKLLTEICINCFNITICNSFLSCIICHAREETFGLEKEGYPDCCCCCCCIEYNEEDFKKDNQFFCYCYQAKRSYSWLNKCLTNEIQQKIFPYLIEYFILRLSIIGFERQYEFNHIDFEIEENYIFILVFIGTFFLFFYFTLSFSKIIRIFDEDIILSKNANIDNENDKKNIKLTNLSILSNEILFGVNGILFFNSIFSLIFSSVFQSELENQDKEIIFNKHNYIIFIPILMSKFYHFTLIYYCISYTEDKKQFELISGSTLISIYLSISDLIISSIKNLCDENSINALYITQLVISCLVLLYFLCILLMLIWTNSLIFDGCDCIHECGKICFCFCSFLLCCAGFWYNYDFYHDLDCDCIWDCDCDCPPEWICHFYCCFCNKGSLYYCEPCCETFNLLNPIDYIQYILCCCRCWNCFSCCKCKNICNCSYCDCECDGCCQCCDCCYEGYCCYCCDCCDIYDCCGCCVCI